MQLNKQFGLNQLLVYDLKQFLIEHVLFFGQIDLGKQQAFGEQVIGNSSALEQIAGMDQFFQLFIAFGHKEQFQRERILLRVFIELGQKGIIGKLFQYQPGIVMLAQQMCQRCFSCANVSFYGNKVVFHIVNGEWSIRQS